MAPRAVLGEISGNSRRGKELTVNQRGLIMGASEEGATAKKIAKRYNLNYSTVKKTIQRSSSRINNESKPRSGRPEALTERDKRSIRRLVEANPKLTYAKARAALLIAVSHGVINRFLDSLGMEHWRAKRRPRLTAKHAQKRLEWSIERRDWSAEEWFAYIFSDECSIERGSGRAPWVWGYAEDKWQMEFLHPTNKQRDISVMVWGAIWVGGRSDIVIMIRDEEARARGYTSWSYEMVLEEQLTFIYEPGFEFIQDNASVHTAKRIKDWLKEKGISTPAWPPCSPDLNAIEPVWNILKNRVSEGWPDLPTMGHGAAAREGLVAAIRTEWRALDQDIIDNIIRSMDSRINAVIDAKGWYTRY